MISPFGTITRCVDYTGVLIFKCSVFLRIKIRLDVYRHLKCLFSKLYFYQLVRLLTT